MARRTSASDKCKATRAGTAIVRSGTAMRVLVIEDYEPLRQSLEQGLREAGFAVDVTGDGEEGLWYALSSEYDAIVLDLMLPGRDGLSILRRLRDEGRDSHVLILTAKDALEDKVRALNLGADDYLVKPFAFEELLARLRALVRRSYRTKQSDITVEDLHINVSTQQVTRGGQPILLTPREYALLEYLAFRSGQIVSRTEIWEHVYEFNSSATSNVVDVYVGYLRKKLRGPGRPRLIHTIRGRGYLLGTRP
jgi:DNA-binding response OmpR family regulator